MFVRGTKLIFDTTRRMVTRRFGPRKIAFTSYREFYHLNDFVHISGALKWVGHKIYITESLATHPTNRFSRIYYIHYEDGIVIRHTCDPKVSQKVIRSIDMGLNDNASRYLRWLQQEARKYFLRNREVISDRILSGEIPLQSTGQHDDIYVTVNFGKDIVAAVPGMWFFNE